ncbi:hypothetical protein J7438_09600 [Thalassotalea sp. G20_0]|uniref:hypothetical protein n=1 Tax=Thalassotalea sp. G20_0 TaxID=2821093 RepID=UPI001ADAF742|nr:hypothetical protein [Thalassotalea sp. G20_0]MBO9494337.1 hypothetical protein [Thalassotalea sp. G20_0]
MAGYSVQALDPFSRYSNREVSNQGIPSISRALKDFTISQRPSTEGQFKHSGLAPEELDAIVSCDFSSQPVNNPFSSTDLTFKNSQQIARELPSENSLADFSKPSSRSVAIVGPLNTHTQGQASTGITEFRAPESFRSVIPLPLRPAVTHDQSDKKKEYQKAYRMSERGKAVKRAWEDSRKGRATRKAYQRKCQNSIHQACRRAYSKAYYFALKNTGDREQAKIAGRKATDLIKESITQHANDRSIS